MILLNLPMFGRSLANHQCIIEKEIFYARIVNNNHFHQVRGYMDDTINKGKKVEAGGKVDASQNYIEPTVIMIQ